MVEFLSDPRTMYDGGGRTHVDLPWDLLAEDYLRFARSDFKRDGVRGSVNALANAKRALHCQVDSILYAAGFWDRAQTRRWDFHAKAELLKEMRIVTPAVLGRINRLRNKVEHEYSAPADREQLDNFIDAVDLFVAHAGRFSTLRYDDATFARTYRGADRVVSVRFAAEELAVTIYGGTRVRELRPRGSSQFRALQTATYAALHREQAI